MFDGTIKTVRVRYFNKATWATEPGAKAYLAGFLASDKPGLFDFQIWSQSLGRPEIECVVEFSGAYLEKLRQQNKPCRPEGRLLIWNTEACFRDAAGRWWFVTLFDHFHKSHPNGDRTLVKAAASSGRPSLPVGKWNVAFANGVAETCIINQPGTAYVVEALRQSRGKATVERGAFMIRFEDDRVERWTPVGNRMVVEHWLPGSQLGELKPILGVADRAQ